MAGRCAAVVLAAGRSERFGSDKRFALVDGTPMLERVLRTIAAACDPVVVVLGPGDDEARRQLFRRFPGLRFAVNPEVAEGMLRSLREGLGALTGHEGPVLLALGDQPWVSPGDVAALLAQFESGGAELVQPVHRGKKGHPAVLAPSLWRRAWDRRFATIRDLLHDADRLELVEAGAGTIRDVDLPEDLAR